MAATAIEHSQPPPSGTPPQDRARRTDPWAVGLLATAISAGWSGRPSLWFDESATISAAARRSLPQLWTLLGHIDAVHGLYYVLMHGWFTLFAPTEFWSRFPSALAVGGAAAGVVVLSRQFLGSEPVTAGGVVSPRFVGVCAGLAFAILPRVTWAGVEARSSALSIAVATWLTVLLVAAARRHRPSLWIAYALVMMLSILVNLNTILLVPAHAAMLPLVTKAGLRRSPMLRWAASTGCGIAAMTPFLLFAHGQVFQVDWIRGLTRSVFLDVVHRQYFDYSVPFAVMTAVTVVAALITVWRGGPRLADGGRRLLLASIAWVVIPTATILLYSVLIEPIYYPRYLIFTTPAAAIILTLCIVVVTRRPAAIAAAVIVFAVAAFPNYYFTQRGPYAKEGWDYSQVADLIGSHAAPGDCLVVDNTVPWRPGPIRALVAARPRSFRELRDVERGFSGPEVGALWDGHVAVWLTTAAINTCTTVWTITNHDRTLPDHQTGRSLPPGTAFGASPAYRFPSYLGFRIVERWQFHYSQVLKSTR